MLTDTDDIQPAQLPYTLYGLLLATSSSKYVDRYATVLSSPEPTAAREDCSLLVHTDSSDSVGLAVGTAVGALE
jgi:hypothetical protein